MIFFLRSEMDAMKFYFILILLILSGCKSKPVSDRNLILFFPDNVQQLYSLNYSATYPNGRNRPPVYLQKQINDTLVSFLYPIGDITNTKMITFKFDKVDSDEIFRKIKGYDTNFSDTSNSIQVDFNGKKVQYYIQKTDKSFSLVYHSNPLEK
jgi:hypothetical protein